MVPATPNYTLQPTTARIPSFAAQGWHPLVRLRDDLGCTGRTTRVQQVCNSPRRSRRPPRIVMFGWMLAKLYTVSLSRIDPMRSITPALRIGCFLILLLTIPCKAAAEDFEDAIRAYLKYRSETDAGAGLLLSALSMKMVPVRSASENWAAAPTRMSMATPYLRFIPKHAFILDCCCKTWCSAAR